MMVVLGVVGMSSCKNDDPQPDAGTSFVTKYVVPEHLFQCDTMIALPWDTYGRPQQEIINVVTGPALTPGANPGAFRAMAMSKGDVGYTQTPFNDIECLSEPILAIKVVADEDISTRIPRGTDLSALIEVKIADIYEYVASGYGWTVGTDSPGKAYRWYSGTVSGYTPEKGRMVDPRSIRFSIGDRDLRQYLSEKSGGGNAACRVLVTLTFPSGDISASVYAYTVLAM